LQARYRGQRFEHGLAVRRSDHVAGAAIAAARALMSSASLRRWAQIPPMSWARASICSARPMWSFAIPRRVCAFKRLSRLNCEYLYGHLPQVDFYHRALLACYQFYPSAPARSGK
jgi:hypothetical protein